MMYNKLCARNVLLSYEYSNNGDEKNVFNGFARNVLNKRLMVGGHLAENKVPGNLQFVPVLLA